MKKFTMPLLLVAVILFGITEKANAQKQLNGLYLTYNDYVNHKLSYTANPADVNGNKLIIHEFIGMKNVTVISNGKKITLPKSEVFGYHSANNNDYRFFDNKAYQIIDTTGFYIYSYDKLIQQGKGPKPTRVYYFSRKDNDMVLPLNAENIAMAFPKNQKFKYMVEVAAKTDIKLDAYDTQSNEYKIKEIYTESLK